MWALVGLCLLISSSIFHYLARFHLRINRADSHQKKLAEEQAQESKIFKKKLFNNLSLRSQIKKVDPNTKYALLKEQYVEVRDKDGLYQFSELTNSLLYTYSMLLLGKQTSFRLLCWQENIFSITSGSWSLFILIIIKTKRFVVEQKVDSN